jgi:hypothetical protein
MQYLMLIYANEAAAAKHRDADTKKMMDAYRVFTQSIIESGQFKAGDALESSSTATTVRVRDGKVLTTDGPFAETHEQLGGYYLIDAKNLDEAIKVASRVPSAQFGSIEVRPIRVFN